jgi:hypothetical protein
VGGAPDHHADAPVVASTACARAREVMSPEAITGTSTRSTSSAAPGVEISMDALFARAARLFRVDFAAPPKVIGKTTQTALQSGLVYGFAGQVDEIVSGSAASSALTLPLLRRAVWPI